MKITAIYIDGTTEEILIDELGLHEISCTHSPVGFISDKKLSLIWIDYLKEYVRWQRFLDNLSVTEEDW